MAIRHEKNLRLISKQRDNHVLGIDKKRSTNRNEQNAYLNESDGDEITDNEALSYFLDNDEGEAIPRELVLALKRRAVACLKENNIPIPDSLKGI